MKLKKADVCDFEKLKYFYTDAVNRSENTAVFSRWIYGKHPTDDMIKNYIKNGAIYFWEENGRIFSAVAVTDQSSDYHGADWSVEFADNKVAVVHILCVSPDCRGRGIGRRTMQAVLELGKTLGKKAVRLDALFCNAPAHRLYESIGFCKKGSVRWHTENTGIAEFYLYELLL